MEVKIITDGEEKTFNVDRVSDISIENDKGSFDEIGVEHIDMSRLEYEELIRVPKDIMKDFLDSYFDGLDFDYEFLRFFTQEQIFNYIIDKLELDPDDLTYYCTCDECLKWNEDL